MSVPGIDPFLDQVRSFEVPFTSRVGICADCDGRGDLGACRTCTGRNASLAAQTLGCPICGGTRREPCSRCQCNGRVVFFEQLVVECSTIQLVHAPDYPVSWVRVGLAAVGALSAAGAAVFVLSL